MNDLTLVQLTRKKCRPCSGESKPLERTEAENYLKFLKDWKLAEDGKTISRTYSMKGFAEAVELIQNILPVAEADDHHPDLHLTGYRRLTVEMSTHSIGGLSENDFILAAKIESLPKKLKT